MSRPRFTVDFPLGKVVVYTGPGGRFERVQFDLEGKVPDCPSRSREAELMSRYLSGERVSLGAEVDLSGVSPFRREIYRKVMEIPYGETRTYGEVAAMAGRPKAARSVGQAMASNRVPLVIPCHRVVGAGGRMGGFSSGVELKKYLLRLEGAIA